MDKQSFIQFIVIGLLLLTSASSSINTGVKFDLFKKEVEIRLSKIEERLLRIEIRLDEMDKRIVRLENKK